MKRHENQFLLVSGRVVCAAGVKRRGIPLIRLLPRQAVFLRDDNRGGVDKHRFAGAFRQIWERMPRWARATILRHWQPLPSGPRIEIEWEIGAAGMCRSNGEWLVFEAQVVDAMPLHLLETLIAHELAHVAIAALPAAAYGRLPAFYQRLVLPEEQFAMIDQVEEATMIDEVEEAAVCWFTETWGFEAESLKEWLMGSFSVPRVYRYCGPCG